MGHNEYKSETCLNCGYQFKDKDNYCPDCGQANHSLKVPFKHLVLEVLEGTIHLDTKIFKTFSGLIFYPGFITREFNTGKRATYVPPIRIYIFVSFIFFLLANMNPQTLISQEDGRKKQKGKISSISLISVEDDFSDGITQRQFDSLVAINEIPKSMSKQQLDSMITAEKNNANGFTKLLIERSAKIKKEGGKEFSLSFFKNLSYVMFFLMPLFACFVFFFHIKQGHYYYEFLIYSIHLHSFLFLLFSFFIVISIVWSSIYLFFTALLISFWYLVRSMKISFPQSIYSAAGKSVCVALLYGITIALGLLASVIISILLL